MIVSDFRKKMAVDGRRGFFGALSTLCSAGFVAVALYRFGRFARARRFLPFKLLLTVAYYPLFYLVQASTGISVQTYADIGRRFVIQNHTCIFIVAEKIGDDFTACQGVTIGNVRGTKRLPIIGDNVYIEPGAKVLGEIRIGNNVVIRANSLVLADVPGNSVVSGNPARCTPSEKYK
jgi:serine O-acetyltransferase